MLANCKTDVALSFSVFAPVRARSTWPTDTCEAQQHGSWSTLKVMSTGQKVVRTVRITVYQDLFWELLSLKLA